MTKLFATVDLFFFFYWILMTTAVRQGWKYCKCHPVFQDRQVTFILAQGQWVRVQEGHLATKQRLAQGKLGLKVLKPCSVQCERVCKINHAIPDIRWYYGHNSGAHSCWKLNDVIFGLYYKRFHENIQLQISSLVIYSGYLLRSYS